MNHFDPQQPRPLPPDLDALNLQLEEEIAGDQIPTRGLTPEELDVLTPQERFIVRYHRSFYTAHPLHPTAAARERYVELLIAAARKRKGPTREAEAHRGLREILRRAIRRGH